MTNLPPKRPGIHGGRFLRQLPSCVHSFGQRCLGIIRGRRVMIDTPTKTEVLHLLTAKRRSIVSYNGYGGPIRRKVRSLQVLYHDTSRDPPDRVEGHELRKPVHDNHNCYISNLRPDQWAHEVYKKPLHGSGTRLVECNPTRVVWADFALTEDTLLNVSKNFSLHFRLPEMGRHFLERFARS